MGQPKPTASLSGLLLARKGAARPAMRRPAAQGEQADVASNQDDLGWNDMGYNVDPDPNAPMDHDHESARNPLAGAVPEANPGVRAQQEMIAQQLQAQAEVGFDSLPADVEKVVEDTEVGQKETPRPVEDILSRKPADAEAVAVSKPAAVPAQPVAEQVAAPISKPKPKKRAAPGSKAKAAFTLRLDKDRHLKLRLACAVSNSSAQMLVTEALDAFLDNMPEVGQLAARVPSKN